MTVRGSHSKVCHWSWILRQTYSIFKCQTAAHLIPLNHLSSDAKMTIWSSFICIFFTSCVSGQTDGTCYNMPAQRVRVHNFGPVGPPFNMRDSWEWSFEKVRKKLYSSFKVFIFLIESGHCQIPSCANQRFLQDKKFSTQFSPQSQASKGFASHGFQVLGFMSRDFI